MTKMKFIPIFLISIFILLLSGIATAQQQSLGVFKQYDCINLIQVCSNCTYVNFTAVLYPNSSIITINQPATKSGTFYNYSFCNTDKLGTYIVNGVGDVDGIPTGIAYDFEVNQYGRSSENKDDTYAVIFMSIMLIAVTILLAFLGYVYFRAMDWTFFLSFLFWYIALLIPLFMIRMVSTLLINEKLIQLLDTLYIVYIIFYGFMFLMLFIFMIVLVMGYLDWKKKPGWMKRQAM